jgi:beta-galactosidase
MAVSKCMGFHSLTVCFFAISWSSLGNEDASPRSRECFDSNWRFARFGLQADGSRVNEPGTVSSGWLFQLTASSAEADKGNTPDKAFDNDPSTRWCARNGDGRQWLTIDLTKPFSLSKIEIEWESKENYQEKIETSSIGGDAWTAPSFDTPIQFIRISTTALPPGRWASIREVRLYGKDGKLIANPKTADSDLAMSPSDLRFSDSTWRKLDIPHDWGVEGPFRIELAGETGKLPWRGIGWYRKTFTIPESDKGKQVYLDFDGAMANAKVYCNGQYVGTWPYGYNSFRMDLTPFLKFGQKNLIAVRLDTEKWDSRWYPGAGIYRHVWLVKTAPFHVGHWGTFITTPEVSDAQAKVKISVTADDRDPASAPQRISIQTDIFELNADDSTGVKVASTQPGEIALANASATLTQETVIPNPKRWTTWDAGSGKPARYLARTTLLDGDKIIDRYDTPFGVRTLEFTARDGFKLNGQRLAIKGVCNHHDLGALGAALNDRALERQFEILKEMGCNSWRTSHNPPAPELLHFADKIGFLVWDEAFDCWAKGKRPLDYNRLFQEWHVKDLQALVRRDRNHPSVFIWSIGNEVLEQRDVALTKHLADIMRAEDPTRPVSNGYNDPDGGRDSGAALALDIMGVNYFFNEDKWSKDPRYKNMPTLGAETSSCVSSRGEYFFGTNRANWQVTSFDFDRPGWGCVPDQQFRMNARWPHLMGEYVWTGFDYLGEPTPYTSGDATQLLNFRNDPAKRAQLEKELDELAKKTPPSRSSYFGIIDLAGFPKDRFYCYQAHWRPDLPMAHLMPHWNWPERVGQKTYVQLYTSGDEAELFLNGQSQGRKKKQAGKDFRLSWEDVVYQHGELKAVAYKNGKEWATDIVKTTGSPAQVMLSPDRALINADGRDLSFITVRIADKDGLTVPRTDNLVKFEVDGPGEIIAVDNGDATSFEPFQASQRKAFNGLALVIVRSKEGQLGTVTLRATSEGLALAKIQIRTK